MTFKQISTADDLDRVLGERFVILAGSAISAVGPPSLPTVDDFKAEILKAIGASASRDVYQEALGARYAFELASGHYTGLLNTTKFEQAAASSGSDRVRRDS